MLDKVILTLEQSAKCCLSTLLFPFAANSVRMGIYVGK